MSKHVKNVLNSSSLNWFFVRFGRGRGPANAWGEGESRGVGVVEGVSGDEARTVNSD